MIVDILTIIAVYLGIAWSIYMSLIFRREYKKLKKEAAKKVDEIVDKAQQTSEKLILGVMLTAALAAATFTIYSLFEKEG